VRTLLLLAAALAATAAVPAQAPRAKDASTRLHAARLREVIDLDFAGAIAEYQAIACDRSSPERWAAVARLAELQRMGIDAPQPVPLSEAPPAIRKAIEQLQPLAVDQLLAQAVAGAPAASTDERASSLELKRATQDAQRWLRDQSGIDANERMRMRGMRSAPPPTTPRNSELRQYREPALDILARENAGATVAAAALRDLYFSSWWKAPVVTGDPAAAFARVRTNLDAYIKDSNLSSFHQGQLVRLRDELEQRGANDPQAALQLVLRLPIYAERLLAEPAAPAANDKR
jgi:hypothetical protein